MVVTCCNKNVFEAIKNSLVFKIKMLYFVAWP